MKIRPVGAQLFHAGGQMDRRTDMTKLVVVSAILRKRLKELKFTTYNYCGAFRHPTWIQTGHKL